MTTYFFNDRYYNGKVGRPPIYPFREMGIRDVREIDISNIDGRRRVLSALHQHKRRHGGLFYTETLLTDDGRWVVRVEREG